MTAIETQLRGTRKIRARARGSGFSRDVVACCDRLVYYTRVYIGRRKRVSEATATVDGSVFNERGIFV